jgi:hypothetical protein
MEREVDRDGRHVVKVWITEAKSPHVIFQGLWHALKNFPKACSLQ